MKNLYKKMSTAIVTLLVLGLVGGFALSGMDGFNSTPVGAVALVNGDKIEVQDYQMALNQRLKMYEQMFGGKPLTAAQIRQFRISQGVLDNLIQSKLMTLKAKEMELRPGEDEVKQEIKKLEYFLTDGKFDVNKYKGLLAANGYTPNGFEKRISEDLTLRKLQPILQSISVSKGAAKLRLDMKNNKAFIAAVRFDREKLTSEISVPVSKVKNFIKDPNNKSILESLYKSQQSEFNSPEQVKARHILLKTDGKDLNKVLAKAKKIREQLTPQNFAAKAATLTEDPSGKGSKGGSLGFFSRGKMVPEFEKVAFSLSPGQISTPVKTQFGYHLIYVEEKKKAVKKELAQVQERLAKKHLQKTDREALDKLTTSLTKDIKEALLSENKRRLEQLAKKYSFKLSYDIAVNPLELQADGISFSEEDFGKRFVTKDTKQLIDKQQGSLITLAKVLRFEEKKLSDKDYNKALETEVEQLNRQASNQFQQEYLDYLKENASIKTFPHML